MRNRTFLITAAPLTAAMLFAGPAIGQTERERQQQQQRQSQPGQQQRDMQQRDMQQQRDGQQQTQSVYMFAGKATSKNVVNASGENLGKISDLIVNVENGSVPYAVVSFGGFLGMGRDSVAVPLAAFRWDPNEDELVLDTTRERLENAPDFDKNNWDNLHDENWRSQVRRAFGMVPEQDRGSMQRGTQPGTQDARSPQDMRDQDRRNPQDTRRDQERRNQDGQTPSQRQTQDQRTGGRSTGEFKPFMMMSDLKGAQLTGSNGERIGRIDDAIIDQSSGHLGFVTVSTGGVLGMGSSTRPVPWEALERNGESEFRLSVAENRMAQGPELSSDDATRLNNQQFRQSIYTFYQVQARQQPRWQRDGQQSQDSQQRDWDRNENQDRDRDRNRGPR